MHFFTYSEKILNFLSHPIIDVQRSHGSGSSIRVLIYSNVRTETREISIWLKFVCWVKHFQPLSRARFNLMHRSIPSGSVCTSASRGSLFCCSTNHCLCWGPLEMRQSSFYSIFLSMCATKFATFVSYDKWKTKIDSVFIDTVHSGFDGDDSCCFSVTSVEAICCYFCNDTLTQVWTTDLFM